MPDPLGTPEVSSALIEALGIKGRYGVQLDDILLPGVTVLTVDKSPFAIATPIMAERSEGPVVGNFTGIAAYPAEGKILELQSITIQEVTGAAETVGFYRLNPADLAGTVTVNSRNGFWDTSGETQSGILWKRAASEVIEVQHTARLSNAMFTMFALADGEAVINFPHGFMLNGNNPYGRFALVGWSSAVNTMVRVRYIGREWTIVR